MNVLDLFSGIGGFSLGLERAGMRTVAFCEIEPFCRKVLRKHWPDVPIFEDVRELTVDILGNLICICDDGSVITQIIGRQDVSKRRDSKYDCAVEMYDKGLSIQDCAEFFGITRQAMHKILKRRGCVFRSNKRYRKDNHFFRSGYTVGQKRAAHVVEKAIKKGIIIPSATCEVCGATKTFRDGRRGIQAHHDDYNKPLEVRWLCQKCHHEWHKTNSPKEIEEVPAEQSIDVVCGGYP